MAQISIGGYYHSMPRRLRSKCLFNLEQNMYKIGQRATLTVGANRYALYRANQVVVLLEYQEFKHSVYGGYWWVDRDGERFSVWDKDLLPVNNQLLFQFGEGHA
jgi:hypothetical protein